MIRLNFHHLYYFWMVAKHGKLTDAATSLRLSQSALSMQIKQLEQQLDHALFQRVGRQLKLTEVGRITFTYADEIFRKSEELQALLADGKLPDRQIIRIGGVSTLSRNFQEAFIRPLIDREDVHLMSHSGPLDDLLTRLGAHTLDIVLSNVAVQGDDERPLRCHRVARQPASIVGRPRNSALPFRFPEDLHNTPILLPGTHSEIRAGFDLICDQYDIRPKIAAEVDDMAMLRLLARDSQAYAVLPPVVVRDEIAEGALVEHAQLPGVFENFYAIHIKRNFGSPLIRDLLNRSSEQMLAPASDDASFPSGFSG